MIDCGSVPALRKPLHALGVQRARLRGEPFIAKEKRLAPTLRPSP
jgi:hypothetical protein